MTDELLQIRRIIGVKKHRQLVENADALRIDAELAKRLVQLLQLLFLGLGKIGLRCRGAGCLLRGYWRCQRASTSHSPNCRSQRRLAWPWHCSHFGKLWIWHPRKELPLPRMLGCFGTDILLAILLPILLILGGALTLGGLSR